MPDRAPVFASIILAAGASSRMGGRDKLMEPVGGATLLRRVVDCACALPDPVIVALPPQPHPRWQVLRDTPATLIPVEQAREGIAASLRAALRHLPACDGAMVLLADLPDLTPTHLRLVRDAAIHNTDAQILRAVDANGSAGHPTLFRRSLFVDLMKLTGDRGAAALLRGRAVVPVPTPGLGATTDLDTPEDWACWRAVQEARRD